VEVVTKSGKDPATTLSVEGVGLTNQPPVVELNTLGVGEVSINGAVATVPIGGIIRDAFMDNVAPGKGADISKATVYVNGEVDRVIDLARQTDGPAALWRNYPAKITIPSISVIVPASGIASIRLETEPNAAGIKGSDEIIVEFTEHRQPDQRVGAYTREYFLNCSAAFSATVVNTLTLRVGSEPTVYTLTETGPATLLFRTPAPLVGQPILRQFSVQMLSSYVAQPTQVETIQCHLTDSEFTGGFWGSAQPHLSCTETGTDTGVFRFFETEPGVVGSYFVTHMVASVTQPPAASLVGNHPFTIRFGEGIGDSFTKLKLGVQTFDTVTLSGFSYPRLDDTRQLNAYLIWNEALAIPQKEILYYDANSATLKRVQITDEATDLNAKLVTGGQTADLLTIKLGSLTFVGSDGQPIEGISRVSVQTLVDLINGDNTVVIEDDSWERIRVRPIAEAEEVTVRIRSSEIKSDYFDLKVNPTRTSKQARLVPIADGLYESELKIVVYHSDEGIATLSAEQWTALKGLGYLAVHNTTEEAAQIILNESMDDMPGALLDEHHIFPQFNGSASRYSEFFKKVFDPGEFDIHDFVVPVAKQRHGHFTNQWDRSWKAFIDENTNPDGSLKSTWTRSQLKRLTLDHALHPDSGLCRIYKVNAARVVRYRRSLDGLSERTSTLDRLLKIDSFDGDPNFSIPGDDKCRRWKQLVGATGKNGIKALKKLKHVGAVVAAFTIISSGPKSAAAEALGITPSGVDALLEGSATMSMEIWDPGGSMKQAELTDGSVVREGDSYYWAQFGANGLVGRVDHGEVDYLIATATPGVVHVVVKFGSEQRTYYDIKAWKEGVPEEGMSWPPGW
jgi:hypothetical protein